MGQCSTMPDHHNNGGSAAPSSKFDSSHHTTSHHTSSSANNQYYNQQHHYHNNQISSKQQQRDDYQNNRSNIEGRNPANDMYVDEDEMQNSSGEDSQTPLMTRDGKTSTANMTSFLNVVRQSVNALDPFLSNDGKQQQDGTVIQPPPQVQAPVSSRNTRNSQHYSSTYREDSRQYQQPLSSQQQQHLQPYVLPPNTVRMRCYRLNLDSHSYLSSSHHHRIDQTLHPVASEDEESTISTKQIAISTAKIFRGLQVSRDGTVTSKKIRSGNNSSGAGKAKIGEKSRQAVKIDKAKDLVDQSVKGKKTVATDESGDDQPTNMVSLFIMGEYDDIKHLVRDGSKKLKDADGLPDESLLAINRSRARASSSERGSSTAGPYTLSRDGYNGGPSSSRKQRIDHHGAVSHRNSRGSSSKNHHHQQTTSSSSIPPKLKSHPRDLPRSSHSHFQNNFSPSQQQHNATSSASAHHNNYHHQNSNIHPTTSTSGNRAQSTGRPSFSNRFPSVPHQCSEFNIFGNDSDWSDALNFSKGFQNIWNCGANSTNNDHYNLGGVNGVERGATARGGAAGHTYSNEDFRVMKQQQQTRYDNAMSCGGGGGNVEGREDFMLVDHHHGYGNTSSSKKYSKNTSEGYSSSSQRENQHHHHSSSNNNAASGSRTNRANDVILV